jgi:hypothetical protein
MAILQSTLADDVISRQERSVLRGINRAVQLNEGVLALDKVGNTFSAANGVEVPEGTDNRFPVTKENLAVIREYLLTQIASALVNTRIPGQAVLRKHVKAKEQ